MFGESVQGNRCTGIQWLKRNENHSIRRLIAPSASAVRNHGYPEVAENPRILAMTDFIGFFA